MIFKCDLLSILQLKIFSGILNLIQNDKTVNLNNTSENKLLGLDVSGKVGIHNSFNTSGNNLWNKGEVESRGFFTLTSLTTQKNLIATNRATAVLTYKSGVWTSKDTGFGLVEKGVLLLVL